METEIYYSLMYDSLKRSESPEDQRIVRELHEDYKGLIWRFNKIKNNSHVPPLNSLSYFKELLASRKILEDNEKGFPRLSCAMASRVVKEVTGLEQVAGICRYDLYFTHAWNIDLENGLFLCISMDQYRECDDSITILPAKTDILTIQEIPTIDHWLWNPSYDRKGTKYVREIKLISEGK